MLAGCHVAALRGHAVPTRLPIRYCYSQDDRAGLMKSRELLASRFSSLPNAMLCCDVLCYMLRYALLYAMLCHAMLCYVALRYALLCYALY